MIPTRRSAGCVITCGWCCRDCPPSESSIRSTSRSPMSQMIEVDVDPQETREWLEALDAVIREDGPQRAQELIEAVLDGARAKGAPIEVGLTTPYVNTIPPDREDR